MHPLRLILQKRLAGVVGAIGLLLSITAAHAVSITNRDDQDHKVTIVEGDTKTEHVLKPSQVLNGICGKGCTVHLDDDEEEEYQLEAEDVVSIEEGSLYDFIDVLVSNDAAQPTQSKYSKLGLDSAVGTSRPCAQARRSELDRP